MPARQSKDKKLDFSQFIDGQSAQFFIRLIPQRITFVTKIFQP